MILQPTFFRVVISILFCTLHLHSFGQTERMKRVKIGNLAYPIRDSSERIITHEGYSFTFSYEHNQAYWIAYYLTPQRVEGSVQRSGHFQKDPELPNAEVGPGDYRNSGLDRGHLAPAADMKWDEQAMKESFYFSNISPQNPKFNRGIWRQLEEKVREFVYLSDTLYIVTGPIFGQRIGAIGNNLVTIPNAYYKALLGYWDKKWHAVGFVLEQYPLSSGEISEYAISIDDLERITHINFFHHLPDEIEEAIEREFDYSEWEKKEE